MCLVEDNNIVFWQELAIHCNVQSVNKRIDNNYVRKGGRCSRLFGEAPIRCGATLRAWALVATNADQPPGLFAWAPRQITLVASFGLVSPFNQLSYFGFHRCASVV